MATRKDQDEAARKREEAAAQRRAQGQSDNTEDPTAARNIEPNEDGSNPAGAPETPEPPQGRVVGTRPNPGEEYAASRARQGQGEGQGADADRGTRAENSNAAANANRNENSPNADATRKPGSTVTPMGTEDMGGGTKPV